MYFKKAKFVNLNKIYLIDIIYENTSHSKLQNSNLIVVLDLDKFFFLTIKF